MNGPAPKISGSGRWILRKLTGNGAWAEAFGAAAGEAFGEGQLTSARFAEAGTRTGGKTAASFDWRCLSCEKAWRLAEAAPGIMSRQLEGAP